jgi:predicted DNA-binding transcriptional regulator AlpA
MEVLTVNEVAALLKMSKSQIYELTNEQTRDGAVRENPIPVIVVSEVCYARTDIDLRPIRLNCGGLQPNSTNGFPIPLHSADAACAVW